MAFLQVWCRSISSALLLMVIISRDQIKRNFGFSFDTKEYQNGAKDVDGWTIYNNSISTFQKIKWDLRMRSNT